MAATAPELRRRSPGGPPRPRPGSNASRSWLLAVAGVGVLLLAVYLIHARRAAAAGTLNTSGTPGPDRTGSGAQQPNGGASSVPGALPPFLVGQPDPLTGQVQQADTSSSEAPTMSSSSGQQPYSYVSSTPTTVNGTPVTSTIQVNGQTFEQDAPGSDYFRPTPTQQSTSDVHKPGVQL